MLQAGHPDENVLESYCMNKLDGPELAAFEEHLLLCADCQDHVTNTDSFLRGMRAGLINPEFQKSITRWNVLNYFQMPVPVWATAAVAVAGVGGIIMTHNLSNRNMPLAIALSATRGGAAPVAKAGGPLDLDLDARDLAQSGVYRVQIVNSDGAEMWSVPASAQNGHVHALVEKRLAPGQYYVRIADPTGARREFALRLGN